MAMSENEKTLREWLKLLTRSEPWRLPAIEASLDATLKDVLEEAAQEGSRFVSSLKSVTHVDDGDAKDLADNIRALRSTPGQKLCGDSRVAQGSCIYDANHVGQCKHKGS